MIPLPSPPTDSLYKFITVLFAFIFAFCSIVPHILVSELHTEYSTRLDRANEIARQLQLPIDLNREKPVLQGDKNIDRAAAFVYAEDQNLSLLTRICG